MMLMVAAVASTSSIAAAQEVQEEAVVERNVAAYGKGARESPQMWSATVGAGFWLPKNAVLAASFTKCCTIIPTIDAGVLFSRRYGIEGGVGFLYKTAAAIATGTGGSSGDRLRLLLVPVQTSFAWRADYFSWRYLVPYLKAGVDYVFFREGVGDRTIKGMKFGLHGVGGIMINAGELAGTREGLDADFGINDFFLTLEAKYQWINNFGGSGLDLSGGVYSAGLLMEF